MLSCYRDVGGTPDRLLSDRRDYVPEKIINMCQQISHHLYSENEVSYWYVTEMATETAWNPAKSYLHCQTNASPTPYLLRQT